MKPILMIAALLLCSQEALSQEASTWKLPLTLNDENTHVEFNVDTTWHVVTGKISGTSGSLALTDENDPLSVSGEIHFPVAKFDTGWDMRDDSLHEHMNSEKYREVVFSVKSLAAGCAPDSITETPCSTTASAMLRICDVEKELALPIEIKREGDTYVVSGDYTLAWAEYNVEDPSILVAKVNPDVVISYKMEVPAEVKPAE